MKLRILAVTVLAALVAVAYQSTGGNVMERFRNMSRQAEEKGLAEPFKGLTATGVAEPGARHESWRNRKRQGEAGFWPSCLTVYTAVR